MEEYYRKYIDSACKELHYTCMIALEKIKHTELKKYYGLDYNRTMEPAAPYTEPELQALITDKHLT